MKEKVSFNQKMRDLLLSGKGYLLDVDTVINLVNKSNDKSILMAANEWIKEYFGNKDNVYKYVTSVKGLSIHDVRDILTSVFSNYSGNAFNMYRFLKVKGCPRKIIYSFIIRSHSSGFNYKEVLKCFKRAVADKVDYDTLLCLAIVYLTGLYIDKVNLANEEDYNGLCYVYKTINGEPYTINKYTFKILSQASNEILIKFLDEFPVLKEELFNIIVMKNDDGDYLSERVTVLGYLSLGLTLLKNGKCNKKQKSIIYKKCLMLGEYDEILDNIEIFDKSIDDIVLDLAKEMDPHKFFCYVYKEHYPNLEHETIDKVMACLLNKGALDLFLEDPLVDQIEPELLIEKLPYSDRSIINKFLTDDTSPFKYDKKLQRDICYDVLNKGSLSVMEINNMLYGIKIEEEFWIAVADKLIKSKGNDEELKQEIKYFMQLHPNIKRDELLAKLNTFTVSSIIGSIATRGLSSIIFSYSYEEVKSLINYLIDNNDKYSLEIDIYLDFLTNLLYRRVTKGMKEECRLLDQKYKNELKKLKEEKGNAYENKKRINF